MYADLSSRFFKNTTIVPGMYSQDPGWNQEGYFSAQDLSPSSATSTGGQSLSRGKR